MYINIWRMAFSENTPDVGDGKFPTDDSFGNSPYLDAGVTGGTIKIKSMKYFIIGILLVLILYIIYRIFYHLAYGSETYHQRKARSHFDNLHGETFDDDAKLAIEHGEAIDEPTAMDHYRLGTTYLVNANNPVRAHDHFNQALNQVINGLVDMKEAPFILDRIGDYHDRFIDFPEIEELPMQQALMAHYEAKQALIKKIEKEKPEIKEDDAEFTQKVLLSRQNWESDSQNVHDSAIFNELQAQYTKVQNENAQIPNIGTKDFNDLVNWLKVRYQDDRVKSNMISKVIVFLNSNYPISSMPNTLEKDIVTAAWRRSYDPANESRKEEIRESIGNSLLDCIEGNNVVCLAGRTAKVWQSLARLDSKDPELGVLKSKQALRNEIYERSAKIVDDYVGKNGSVSDQLKDSYNKAENSEQVKELVECMKGQILKLADEYKGLLTDDQLMLTIKECTAVI